MFIVTKTGTIEVDNDLAIDIADEVLKKFNLSAVKTADLDLLLKNYNDAIIERDETLRKIKEMVRIANL